MHRIWVTALTLAIFALPACTVAQEEKAAVEETTAEETTVEEATTEEASSEEKEAQAEELDECAPRVGARPSTGGSATPQPIYC